jgi:hypothetical protein
MQLITTFCAVSSVIAAARLTSSVDATSLCVVESSALSRAYFQLTTSVRALIEVRGTDVWNAVASSDKAERRSNKMAAIMVS